MTQTTPLELTILMPCLNEARTLPACLRAAKKFLQQHRVKGEILVADNGSSDNSVAIAHAAGARVVTISKRGYGAALHGGIKVARGKFVIMGDADCSYDFTALMPMLAALRAGTDLVMGNRFRGEIKPGAMPALHRYLGNPLLSGLGRLFFNIKIGDFHSGLRGFHRQRLLKLPLQTTGMEFASEMVVQAALQHYQITETPIILYPDQRDRSPHLKSFRDGWRHLKFLLLFSPNWLFFYPSLILITSGLIFTLRLSLGELTLAGVTFGLNTLLYGVAATILGCQLFCFTLFTKVYAYQTQFIPTQKTWWLSLGRAPLVPVGLVLFTLGLLVTSGAFWYWSTQGFSNLDPEIVMRWTLPALATMVIGMQIIFAKFFLDILQIPIRTQSQNSNKR
jgi:glycosyltransferase involved in cell wall biosynthesis